MALSLNDLTVNPANINTHDLLSDWAWAMPEPIQVVLITSMGDAFAQGYSEAVYFVDTVTGSIQHVSQNGDDFKAQLNDAQFVTRHMFPSRVVALRQAGIHLKPRCVYGHKQPLILGGDDTIANVEVVDASVHFSIHGQIHRQVKDLPPGTEIGSIAFQ